MKVPPRAGRGPVRRRLRWSGEVPVRWICRAVIPPDRLTLTEAGISPEAANAWLGLSREDWSHQGFDGYELMA